MTNKKSIKIAGVLLLSAILLFSAVAVTANANEAATTIREIAEQNNFVITTSSTQRAVLYDNGAPDGVNGLSCVAWPGYNREIIDDFTVPSTWQVTGGEYRALTYSGTGSVNGCIVRFFQDTGSGASTTEYANRTATITNTLTGNIYFSRPEILVNCSFSPVTLAPGNWWVLFQTQHSENCFTLTATGQGSSVFLSYPDQGLPRWTDGYVVFAAYYDMAWLLTGTSGGGDLIPPVTTCTLDGVMAGGIYISDVTVTLNATDDDSGVNYTMFKLDAGAWTTYTAPFVVTDDGDHTVYFYSVDNAGNVEDEKNETFTIQHPAPDLSITIKGGIGITAEIKNTGTTNLTDISWTIDLDGSLIFIGKTKSGTIASLGAGETATVKDFVIGLGKTGIAVEADDASANATGTVLLFFVIGVA